MPKLKFRYTSLAKSDMDEIFNYLDIRDQNAAKRVINAIERSVITLVSHPMSGRQSDKDGVRLKVVPNYPYIIFYQITFSHLTVLRVWHSAREWPEQF
jgi:toxin ParE1/3/4